MLLVGHNDTKFLLLNSISIKNEMPSITFICNTVQMWAKLLGSFTLISNNLQIYSIMHRNNKAPCILV